MAEVRPLGPAFDLDARHGLPADLRLLLERYPRETWQEHANLGETARFWLKRHAMFRELGASLDAGLGEFREGNVELAQFRRWFGRRLGFFLGELDGHHRIEDDHYFPLFVAAEPRLSRGFAMLDGDHEIIHGDLEAVAAAANQFLAIEVGGLPSDAARRAADGYSLAADRLLVRLSRHLLDEEDLIVPVILDRGEDALRF